MQQKACAVQCLCGEMCSKFQQINFFNSSNKIFNNLIFNLLKQLQLVVTTTTVVTILTYATQYAQRILQ